MISSLPILGNVQLPDINSARVFDLATKEFKPVQGIAETITKYAAALVSEVNQIIQVKSQKKPNFNFKLIAPGSINKGWSRYQRNPRIQYYKLGDEKLEEHGIRSIAENEELEQFVVKSDGQILWKKNGSLPISVDFNPANKEILEAQIKQKSMITRFDNLPKMLKRPQRVARTLINEAQLLVELARNVRSQKGKKIVNNSRIFIQNKENHFEYKLEGQQKTLTVEVNRSDDQIVKITKSGVNAKRYLVLSADDLGTAKIDEKATLEVHRRLDPRIDELIEAISLEVKDRLVTYQVGTQRIVKGNNISANEKIKHRSCLLSGENSQKLCKDAGIIHNNADSSLAEFFKYTKMPKDSVSFAFASSAEGLSLKNIDGESIDISRFGDHKLRAQIFGRQAAAIRSVRDLEDYMKAIDINVCDQNVDLAIYRWSIKACAEELKKAGIFYVSAESANQKDKVYLVDIGEKENWANIKLKTGPQSEKSLSLRSYPSKELISKWTEGETEIRKPCQLEKVLKAMGFEVPGLIETETFIEQDNEAKAFVEARRQAALASKNKNVLSRYKTLIGNIAAKKFLENNGYTQVKEVQDPQSPMARPWLLFQNGSVDKKLGYISLSNANRKETQTRIIAHAKTLSDQTKTTVIPVEIKVENLNLQNRTGTLTLTELATQALKPSGFH